MTAEATEPVDEDERADERASQDGGTGPSATTLSGEQIVFLSHQRWNTHVTPVHHTVRWLTRRNTVLFMEPPDSMGWLLHEPPAREAMTWIADPLERKHERLWVFHTPPVFLPGQASRRWIQRSLSCQYTWMVRAAQRRLGMRRPIFWVFQFNTVEVLDALRAAFAVYECAEDHAAYEVDERVKRHIVEMDARLCRRADVVLTPSRAMHSARIALNPRTSLVPWGVDTRHYGLARQAGTPVPDDVARLGKPVIGMFGMLDGRRLHVELLLRLSQRHPDWQVVLIGRCMPNLDTRPLLERPNIHLLGMKPVETLPAYCKSFDVCIIPYMLNEFTRSIMPLKLVEYLATGKPAVATALPAALELNGVIRIGATLDEFERHVVEALAEGPESAAARVRRAREYDWEAVAEQKLSIVAHELERRRSLRTRSAVARMRRQAQE